MQPLRVEFAVDGERVVGHLHCPDGPGPHPAAVVAGPMTSVKEQVTGRYARELAGRGIAGLAIDHRHYGESEGLPRGYEHADRKIADLVAAACFLEASPIIDPQRIHGVGVCLGCGYLAHAAARSRVWQSLVFVAGYYRDPPAMRASDPEGFDAKLEQGRQARERFHEDGHVETIPAVALESDAAMQSLDTFDYYTRRAAHGNYTNAFAVMSREHFLPFDVQSAASGIRQPVLRWLRRSVTGPRRFLLSEETDAASFAPVAG